MNHIKAIALSYLWKHINNLKIFYSSRRKHKLKIIFYYLFFIVLFVLPPLFARRYSNDVSLGWLISSLIIGITVPYIRLAQKKWQLYLLALLCVVITILNLVSLTSFWLQGTGINREVLWHIDTDNLPTIISTFKLIFLAASLYTLLSVPLINIENEYHTRRLFSLIILLGAFLAFTPLNKTIDAIRSSQPDFSSLDREEYIHHFFKDRRTSKEITLPENPPNILIIYLESLEQTYFDTELFGDILPNLRELVSRGYEFTNIYPAPQATFTMAGIFSSHLGYPLLSSTHGNQVLVSFNPKELGAGSISTILKDNGYNTAYIGGAQASFAGKGVFLKNNGYDRVYGWEILSEQLPDKEYRNKWGLYDDTLFRFVLKEMKRLNKAQKPWLLTTLTLDTHHPDGMPTPHISTISENDMINAVHQTDVLIERLLADIRENKLDENLMIVLMSDHLAMRNSVTPVLEEAKERKMFFTISAPWISPETIQARGNHFDIPATILEAAGIAGYGEFPMGQSLLSHSQGYMEEHSLDEDYFRGFDILRLVKRINIHTSRLTFNTEEEFCMIDDRKFKINYEGRHLPTFRLYILQFDSVTGYMDRVRSIRFRSKYKKKIKDDYEEYKELILKYLKPAKNKTYIIYHKYQGYLILRNNVFYKIRDEGLQEINFADLAEKLDSE